MTREHYDPEPNILSVCVFGSQAAHAQGTEPVTGRVSSVVYRIVH